MPLSEVKFSKIPNNSGFSVQVSGLRFQENKALKPGTGMS